MTLYSKLLVALCFCTGSFAASNFGEDHPYSSKPVSSENVVNLTTEMMDSLSLSDLSPNTVLSTPSARANPLSKDQLTKIATHLKTNTSLTGLDLESNQMGDDIAQMIGDALATSTTLKSLNLASNRLTDKAAIAIAKGLEQNKSLTELNLNQNDISAAGAKAIAQALAVNTSLKELTLFGNNIGAEGISNIAEALGKNTKTALSLLNMGYNGEIDAKAAQSIGNLVRTNTSLTKLPLFDSPIMSPSDATVIVDAIIANDNTKLSLVRLTLWEDNPFLTRKLQNRLREKHSRLEMKF